MGKMKDSIVQLKQMERGARNHDGSQVSVPKGITAQHTKNDIVHQYARTLTMSTHLRNNVYLCTVGEHLHRQINQTQMHESQHKEGQVNSCVQESRQVQAIHSVAPQSCFHGTNIKGGTSVTSSKEGV